ncbi:MAG: hypothetical protein PHO63_00940 [Bacilli bacterium]|nr:hypothetical protein [Bacilli bacterium]MDD4808537.1 hypothetical protein [Bacilli bacterium]
MKCDLCWENDKAYNYILKDGSSIGICEECGEIVYGKEFIPIVPNDRLFQIIEMMQYVLNYKKCKPKVLVKR